ncbi:MAG: hypothetical protein Q8Q30_02970 [Candidatus Woesebacteria bacterium]|nr:hypothetical protein [Candidatus Woesebacteria bacterium]
MTVREAVKLDEGQMSIAGRNVDINRIIRQKKMLTDINGRIVEIDFYELRKSGIQFHNPAYVCKEGNWITGHTIEKRLALSSRPERQTIFVSALMRLVVSSEPIFS